MIRRVAGDGAELTVQDEGGGSAGVRVAAPGLRGLGNVNRLLLEFL